MPDPPYLISRFWVFAQLILDLLVCPGLLSFDWLNHSTIKSSEELLSAYLFSVVARWREVVLKQQFRQGEGAGYEVELTKL